MWGYIAVALFIMGTSYLAYVMSIKGLESWYSRIITPSGTPGATTIRGIWIVLYILYGIGMTMFVRGGLQEIMGNQTYFWWGALSFVAVGLLGILWTRIFFTNHRIMPSLYISALMAFLILVSAVMFYLVSTLAAALTIIYLIWICYITRLTYQVWELNP